MNVLLPFEGLRAPVEVHTLHKGDKRESALPGDPGTRIGTWCALRRFLA
jgi:hypothetical protein